VRFKCSVFFEPMMKLTTLKLAPGKYGKGIIKVYLLNVA
jgi:hypothetical protein